MCNKFIDSDDEKNDFQDVLNDIYNRLQFRSSEDLTGDTYYELLTNTMFDGISGTLAENKNKVGAADVVTCSNYIAQSGSDTRILADDKIVLSSGVYIHEGAYFIASIENVSGTCAEQPANSKIASPSGNQEMKILQTNSLQLIPNPSNGYFKVLLPENSVQLLIYNGYGRVVYETLTGEATEITIDLSQYARGIYILHNRTGSGAIQAARVVIE